MYFLNDDEFVSLGLIFKRDSLISCGKSLKSLKNCLRPVSSVNGSYSEESSSLKLKMLFRIFI